MRRATGILSNPKCASRSIPAGPPLITEDLQCIGRHKIRFGLYFTDSVYKTYQYLDEFLGTSVSFVQACEIEEKTFMKIKENQIFYGINDNKEAILYDIKKDKLDFIKLT